MRRRARSAVLAATCAAIWSGASGASRVDSVILDHAAPVAPFTLDDHDGKPFTPESLKGHWSLVLAGYTNCPDICPFTLANLDQVMTEAARLRADRLPAVIFLAVDPARDRANLKDYVEQFNPHFVGVTGKLDQIDRALKGFDAVAVRSKPDAQGNYSVSHSAAVAVVDPQARLVAKINPPFDPQPTAQFLVDLFRRAGGR